MKCCDVICYFVNNRCTWHSTQNPTFKIKIHRCVNQMFNKKTTHASLRNKNTFHNIIRKAIIRHIVIRCGVVQCIRIVSYFSSQNTYCQLIMPFVGIATSFLFLKFTRRWAFCLELWEAPGTDLSTTSSHDVTWEITNVFTVIKCKEHLETLSIASILLKFLIE